MSACESPVASALLYLVGVQKSSCKLGARVAVWSPYHAPFEVLVSSSCRNRGKLVMNILYSLNMMRLIGGRSLLKSFLVSGIRNVSRTSLGSSLLAYYSVNSMT